MTRTPRFWSAWAIGWVVAMAALLVWGYDGIPTLLFGTLSAAILSAGCVAIMLLAGLVLRVPTIARLWNSGRVWAAGLAALSVTVIPDFPDEPLSMAQDLREPPWFSGFFALFLPS
jgi:hypothetical protein